MPRYSSDQISQALTAVRGLIEPAADWRRSARDFARLYAMQKKLERAAFERAHGGDDEADRLVDEALGMGVLIQDQMHAK